MLKKWFVVLVCLVLLPAAAAGSAADSWFETDGKTLVRYTGYDQVVTVPKGIQILGEQAFGAGNVTKIILPDSLKEIRRRCFGYCYELREITLPASVSVLEQNPFSGAEALEAIGVSPKNKTFTAIDGVVFTKDGETLTAFPSGKCARGSYEIPEGTRDIDTNAFRGSRLTSVTIPASLTSWRLPGALGDCESLREIRVAEGNPVYFARDGILYKRLTEGGNALAFYPRKKPGEEVTAETFAGVEDLREIGNQAFSQNDNLKKITFPEGVETVYGYAVHYCRSLREIVFPASVREFINYTPFSACEQLASVTFRNPETVFPEYMEWETIRKVSPDLIVFAPAGSTAEAFFAQHRVPVIDPDLPGEEREERIRAARETMEAEREAERAAEIEESVQQAIDAGIRYVKSGEAALFYEEALDEETGKLCVNILAASPVRDLTIPGEIDGKPVHTVKCVSWDILDTSHYMREMLETLTVEDGAAEIADGAFELCVRLREVTLPDSLQKIGQNAFSGCRSLESIRLPVIRKGEKTIFLGEGAFRGIRMDDLVFADGTSLREMTIAAMDEGTSGDCFATCKDGYVYLILDDGSIRLLDIVDERDWEIPEKVELPAAVDGRPVTEINGSGYGYNTVLEITVPEGVRVLGNYAFTNRGVLETVHLPSTLERIGKRTFAGCTYLREADLPENLKTIDENAFENCVSLSRINLPESLESIGSEAFMFVGAPAPKLPEGTEAGKHWYLSAKRMDASGGYEYALNENGAAVITRIAAIEKKMTVPAAADGIPVDEILWDKKNNEERDLCAKVASLTMEDGIREIGEFSFYGFSALKKLELPASVRIVCNNAFEGAGIQAVTLSEGLEEIGKEAFARCEKLKKIELPSTLRIIGESAFRENIFSEITFPAALEKIGDKAFSSNRRNMKKAVFLNPETEIGKGVFGFIVVGTGSTEVDPYIIDVKVTGFPVITVHCIKDSTADRLYQFNVKKVYLP